MTVYRTLDLLTELGLIRPVYQGTAAAHYILLEEGHHHHLVCSRCQDVIEFKDCTLLEIEEIIGSKYGFNIEGHLLEIYGRCQNCHE
jgi:Fur family ferric uptake transcriptional regulator